MSCASSCIKWLLFIFNFLFALGGLAIFVCGVLIRMALTDVVNHMDAQVSVPATLLIAVGAVIFIIAFFGCCGAIRESHCMIVTFAVMLLTLLVIQVALATYAFITYKGEDIELTINKGLKETIDKYFSEKAVKEGVDSMQGLLQCCGYNGYTDFVYNTNNTQHIIPGSCCNKQEGTCEVQQVNHVKGCKDVLYPKVKYYGNVLGGLALGIAAVELIGIIFSFCLANSIRNVERRGYKV